MPAFLFLGVGQPWVYALAEELARHHPVHAIRSCDWLNFLRRQPNWPRFAPPVLLRRTVALFPPGYAGRLEWGFRSLIQRRVKNWCLTLAHINRDWPWVIVPYPYLATWVRNVPAERLIYYNLDNYVLYNPVREKQITAREAELINRASLTLCLSQRQTEALRLRHPGRAACIRHFPLGVIESFLNPQPAAPPPQPHTVGYIGNLIQRVDWELVSGVARCCPELIFQFVGELNGASRYHEDSAWKEHRRFALSLPNVKHSPKVSQEEAGAIYRSFALNWIPYRTQDPFNIFSCPTKIMDGLASGRPLVSTDVPECRLYDERIAIVRSVEEAAETIRRQLAAWTPGRASSQVAFTSQHTWHHRAKTFIDLLPAAVARDRQECAHGGLSPAKT